MKKRKLTVLLLSLVLSGQFSAKAQDNAVKTDDLMNINTAGSIP